MRASSREEISRNHILARLPERELKRLLPHLRSVAFPLKKVIYRPGERIRYVYFPQDSVVSMIAPMDDGRSVEVNLIGREGVVGVRAILTRRTYRHDSVVQIAGGCLRISAALLRAEFKRGGVLQDRLLHYTSYLLVQTEQTAACNRVHRIEQRMGRWLLMTRDRVQRDDFAMTHEFLAEMLGAARSEVTIAAGSLRRSGIIQYQRGRVTILNRKGLERAACECYRILYSEMDAIR
ncbi:MAG: Crp/Fnr family transcriptional regulator [Terriglobia bacterium]